MAAICVALGPYVASAMEGMSRCSVEIGLATSQVLTTAQFTIDYSRVQGTFAGSGLATDCRTELPGVLVTAFDDCDGDYAACQWGESRHLNVSLLDAAVGFSGPREILRCTFETAEDPDPLDFRIAAVPSSLADTTARGTLPTPHIDILAVNCSRDRN